MSKQGIEEYRRVGALPLSYQASLPAIMVEYVLLEEH
jgi:hypothetical protein